MVIGQVCLNTGYIGMFKRFSFLLILGSLPLSGCTCYGNYGIQGDDIDLCANGTIEGDGTETDIDCGGSCGATCANGQACAVNEDCLSDSCENDVCVTNCGDGIRQENEDCDGTDMRSTACTEAGDFNGGIVSCTDECTFDTTLCTFCGDGIRQESEACDNADLGTETCASAGDFNGGTLGCTDTCTLETSQCGNCGDGTRSDSELCEGGDLNGQTCMGLGMVSGDLSCTATCTFDITACQGCPPYTTTAPTSISNTWEVAGPPGGNITALLALGNDTVLAGTGFTRGMSGGAPAGYGSAIYRSTDGGVSFSERQRFVDSTVRVLVRVGTSDRIYAGVGSLSGSDDDGVWMSDDGGVSWTNVSTGLHSGARVRGVVVAAGTPERVYAMVEGTAASPTNAIPSLYRRDNGGAWAVMSITGVTQVTGGPALAMAAHISNRDRLYLANGDRFFVSNNAGATFSSTAFGTTAFPSGGLRWVYKLYADPEDAQHLVLTTYDDEMFESTNGGSAWAATDVSVGGQNDVTFGQGSTYVATRGHGLEVSSAGTFSRQGSCMAEPVPTAVSIAPDNVDQIFVGFNGQGVLHSVDGGQVFTPQSSGITDLAARLTITGPSTTPIAWVVSGAGLFRSADKGDTWRRYGDKEDTLAYSAVAQDPNDADHIVAATNGEWYDGAGYSKGIFNINIATGITTPASGLTKSSVGVIALAFDPSTEDQVFAYQQASIWDDPLLVPSGLFLSADGGTTFSATSMLGQSLVSRSLFGRSPLQVTSAGTIYMGALIDTTTGNVEVWRSTNSATTKTSVWSGTRNRPNAGVYISSGGDIYLGGPSPVGVSRSTDGGAIYSDFSTGLTEFAAMVRDMAFTPSGGILVGTVDGVYYAANGTDFVELNQGFDRFDASGRLEVHTVSIIPGTPNVAIVGTQQGVYRRQLP